MKTVAIMASGDTKRQELEYALGLLKEARLRVTVIDPATAPGYRSPFPWPRERLAAEIGLDWEAEAGRPKHELLEIVAEGAAALAARLCAEGRLHGILALGGLQNSTAGARAMKRLPLGIPKVLVSTVASGRRTFDQLVGTRDILVLPSIVDLAGLNTISRHVLRNAVWALVGMVRHAGGPLGQPRRPVVGTTLMGATNDGVDRAARLVERAGYEVMAFHTSGAGGQALEELIEEGLIEAVMDLTLHEVVYEYFGRGFGYSPARRLTAGAAKGLPMVVAPGGLDFICQWGHELFPDAENRRMIWHNAQLAHVRLSADELRAVAGLVVERLNGARGPVTVLLPRRGLRSFTRPGEPLHDPDLDQLLFTVFERGLRQDFPLKYVDANLMDEAFSRAAAEEMLKLLRPPARMDDWTSYSATASAVAGS